ncbi:MAG: hypothetical protein ABJF10_08130 [Chthoniobacter sp.]|uniref:hypothetical protein n=1 Tax=Chthoniobacter sp. TaxID=2510640 RepID=UPI0032A8F15F
MDIDIPSLTYAILTVFVTVWLVVLVRVFGKLPVSLVGPDLNLLTYGFLWDTAMKALKEQPYWPSFEPLLLGINKPTTLFTIALLNFILLAANFKIAYRVEKMTDGVLKTWIGKPSVTTLGVFSLIVFLWAQAKWEPEKKSSKPSDQSASTVLIEK